MKIRFLFSLSNTTFFLQKSLSYLQVSPEETVAKTERMVAGICPWHMEGKSRVERK
jgi:hypothetical protein